MARRMPLMPIDSNKTRNQELSPWLRGSIQTWAAIGLGTAEIARKTFLTPATVQSTLQRNNNVTRVPYFLAPAVLRNYPLVIGESF
jgi:hypothetical protein